MWLLGLIPGGHTIFCASCHIEKVAENFGFTTIVCYTNIVSKKERRKLTTTRHTTREKENDT
nr:MAG TPA: Diheme cytochrome c [Caudoviricetes sp.]